MTQIPAVEPSTTFHRSLRESPPGESSGDGRPVKVLMLTVGLGVGGTEGQILEIASRLDRRRFDVTVCALKGEGVIAHELRNRGIRVITLNGKGKWDVRVLYRLIRCSLRLKPDLIHAFLSLANLAACVVRRVLPASALILSYRDVDVWKRWPLLMIDRATVGWADAITCSSEAVRQFALARIGGSPEKFVTIHNGIDVGRFHGGDRAAAAELGLQDGVAVVGTVCRLEEPKKGLTVLLQAMASLMARPGRIPRQLLIVGEGPAEQRLRDLSEELGIAQRVRFAGMRRDVTRLLPLMDVFVLPSLYEGFGIAIIEAMAAGLPVVATAVGGIPEVVVPEKTGLLVPPGDPAALAAAIERLLDHPDQARVMGAHGREHAQQKFSIESVVRQHAAWYESFVGKSGSSLQRRAETP